MSCGATSRATGTFTLAAGDSLAFDAVFQAYPGGGEPLHPDVAAELAASMAFVRECIDANLVLETPDPVIDTQFRYAKLRVSGEHRCDQGRLHARPRRRILLCGHLGQRPGRIRQPLLPFLGYGVGNASALNSFRHFARFMNPAYEPSPSSVIAEGDDIWNGAGDCGDAAMIACGRHATPLRAVTVPRPPSCGCRSSSGASNTAAASLRPTASWLPTPTNWRGRFPTGDANPCTSTLYYDALLSAVSLGRELGVESAQDRPLCRTGQALARAIDAYFGGEVGGYDTYRYYAGNTPPRSWICMPLIVGLKERSEGTVRALLGPELMTDDGLPDPAGQLDVLGSLDALRPARDLQRGAGRPCDRTAAPLFALAPAGRPCALSHRGVARRLATATFRPRAGSTAASSPRACSASAPRGCGRSTSRLPCPSARESMSLRHIGRSAPISTSMVARVADGRLRITVARPGANRKYTARHPARRYG